MGGSGGNSQKDLLSLIRDVSTEKSQGERRVVNLKRQIEEVQSEIESANSELEEAKRLKECTEQELKGYEVELALNESSIQILEGRISSIQDEISTIGSDLEALKSEEGNLRDDFIGQMFDLNAKIRKFQQLANATMNEAFSRDTVSQDGSYFSSVNNEDAQRREVEEAKRDLEVKLTQLLSETKEEEHLFQSEQSSHIQEQKELDDLKHRISLMDAVMLGTKELQEISMQTSKLEEACTSLGELLQKKCICPSCHCDNAEMLSGVLQKS
uniref:myosin-1 n=1 Tax=Erigeron canadensis TaxID=72917 RepID=UPI001CB90340|nr:myosin-1 [Erigeron canadensis]